MRPAAQVFSRRTVIATAAAMAPATLGLPAVADAATGRGTVLHTSRAPDPVVTFAVPGGWVHASDAVQRPLPRRGDVVRFRTGADRRIARVRRTGTRARDVRFLAEVSLAGSRARLRVHDGLTLPLGKRYRLRLRGRDAGRGDLVHGEQVRVRWRLGRKGGIRSATIRLPASVPPAPGPVPEPGPAPTPTPEPQPDVRRLYWGAVVNGLQPDAANMAPGGAFDQFERRVGKRLSIIQWGQPWRNGGVFQRFPAAAVDAVRRHGSIPLVNWASWDLGAGPAQPNFQSRDVAAGTYDAYVRQWALDAKRWGHPLMLRFNHEMNGWWYPWGEGKTSSGAIVNGNAPGDYVRAWRRVKSVFDAAGATNVTWVWTPNYMLKSPRYPPLTSLYPGDDAVHWTGLSVYNRGGFESPSALMTGVGAPALANSYEAVLDAAPTKPMLLAEAGSVEAGDGGARKAEWIRQLLADVPEQFPAVRGIVYFDWPLPGFETVPIRSSSAAQQAFAAGIQSPLYVGNAFGALSGPIKPPA